MAGEWTIIRLGQVAAINPDAIGSDWPYPHIRYIDISSVGVGEIKVPPQWMKVSDAPSRAKRLVRKGDTILSTVRPNRRSMFFVSQPSDDWVVSTGFAVLRPKTKLVDPRFLYACVLNQAFTEYLITREKGAAYPAVSPEDIAKAEIALPPLKEQQAIARILGAFDDKIELNQKMNRTLEAMAHAIFKSWFVDFDPVRAKAEGRDAGLPKKIADLFPDSFEDSVLGEIPKGWRVKTVGKACELSYGKALKADQRQIGNIPVMGSNGQVGSHDEALVKGPGIVVGRKGNPGTITWVSSDFFPIDTTFYVVPLSKDYPLTFLAFALDNLDLSNLGADSAVPGLNRNITYMSNILVPTPEVLYPFDRVASLIRIRQKSTEEESHNLAALRDALLPKLITGDLKVQEADIIVGRCL